MVFQDPSTTLNPVYTVGEQIAEAIRIRENPADSRSSRSSPLVSAPGFEPVGDDPRCSS